MPEIQSLTKTRITGEIVRVRFENPENGFKVAIFRAGDGTKFPITGIMPGISAAQFIEADGYFEDHREFGRQFKVDSFRVIPPATTEGIARFLRHAINGIGPKTAAAIVEKFGKETVTVLDLYPGRLKEIKKIGKGKAEKIIAAQKARGAGFTEGNLVKRIKSLIPILIPLFASVFRRAFELATAMTCRCYRGGDGRTRMNTMRLKSFDIVILILSFVFLAGIVSCNFWGIGYTL